MNDPTNYGRRIATGTNGLTEEYAAKYDIDEAARLSKFAKAAADDNDHPTAIRHYLELFNVRPSN